MSQGERHLRLRFVRCWSLHLKITFNIIWVENIQWMYRCHLHMAYIDMSHMIWDNLAGQPQKMILRRPQGQVLGQATHCVQYIDWHCYKGSTPKATGCKTRDAPLLCHCEVPQTLLVNIGVAVIYMAKPSSCKVLESEASECGGSFSDGRWEGFMMFMLLLQLPNPFWR